MPVCVSQAIGINYNPCVISVSPRGLDVTAAGVNIQPNVIEVLGEGLAIWPWAINIQPALVYVNPWGANIRSRSLDCTPQYSSQPFAVQLTQP